MPDRETKFENGRVRISEVIHDPGVPRESYVRPSDQVIVFLDECRYERLDVRTGERLLRERKPGDVLWHPRGEVAPVLINRGERPYRTIVIEIKP